MSNVFFIVDWSTAKYITSKQVIGDQTITETLRLECPDKFYYGIYVRTLSPLNIWAISHPQTWPIQVTRNEKQVTRKKY